MVSAPIPLPAAASTLTAGDYLRQRRQAAGFSIEGVARFCASSPVSLPAAVCAIALAEADREPLADADLDRLATAFPIDALTYRRLVHRNVTGDTA